MLHVSAYVCVVARGEGPLCIVMGCGTSESKLGSVHNFCVQNTKKVLH